MATAPINPSNISTVPASAGNFLESEALLRTEKMYSASRDMHLFSQLFADNNHDLIKDGSASVLQARSLQNGELVGVNNRLEPSEIKDRITLVFNCSQRQNGSYIWEIARANNSGRTIQQLYIDKGVKSGQSFWFDRQGTMRDSCELLDSQVEALSAEVRFLSSHSLAKQRRRELRAQCGRVQFELGRYAVEGPQRWPGITISSEKKEEEIARLQKRINDIGFLTLRPFNAQ